MVVPDRNIPNLQITKITSQEPNSQISDGKMNREYQTEPKILDFITRQSSSVRKLYYLSLEEKNQPISQNRNFLRSRRESRAQDHKKHFLSNSRIVKGCTPPADRESEELGKQGV